MRAIISHVFDSCCSFQMFLRVKHKFHNYYNNSSTLFTFYLHQLKFTAYQSCKKWVDYNCGTELLIILTCWNSTGQVHGTGKQVRGKHNRFDTVHLCKRHSADNSSFVKEWYIRLRVVETDTLLSVQTRKSCAEEFRGIGQPAQYNF